MPAKTPEKIARAHFDCLETGDFSTWEELLAPGFTCSYPGLRGAHDKAEALAFNKPLRAAFPNLEFTVTGSARAGDLVFLSWSGTGTQWGPLVTPAGTLPPTGKSLTIYGVMVATVRNGRIQREETYWNVAELVGPLAAALAPA